MELNFLQIKRFQGMLAIACVPRQPINNMSGKRVF